MTFPPQFGRAALLGLLLGVGACDIADFAASPKTPIFEQTWDLPAKGTSISVASLLPPGVEIYSTPGSNPPDSSAFLVDIATIPITRRVGDDCAQCQTLNGTNAVKPAFVLATGTTQPLPQDMVSGTVLGGTLRVTLTNGMSFDPLFVRTGPPPQTQGHMVLVVRSGSLVLGRDSVNGATQTFAPGSQLVRTINVGTGTVTNGLSVEVTLNSPQGDHDEFINANGTLSASATLRDQATPPRPTLRVGSVSMNVVNRTMSNVAGDSLPFDNLEEGMADRVQRGDIVMTITNPFAVTGNVDVRFAYGPQPSDAITKTVSLPTGAAQVRTVSLNNAEIQQLVGKKIGLSVGGGVNSTAPITVTPKQIITIDNRVRLVIHVGGN